MNGVEGAMEQDPMPPPMSSACLLSMENFSQRISLIREMRNSAREKENSQKKPNNNHVVIKHSQGPLLFTQGL